MIIKKSPSPSKLPEHMAAPPQPNEVTTRQGHPSPRPWPLLLIDQDTKPITFLWSNNKYMDMKLKIEYHLQSLKEKLSITLTKHVRDLHTVNYKVMRKRNFEVPNKWRDVTCSWTRNFNSINVRSSQIDIQAQCNSYQNPEVFAFRYRQKFSKFIWKGKGTKRAKAILKKE